MKNYSLTILFCLLFLTTTVHADVISNPLIWFLYDPFFLIVLIIGVCLLSVLLRKILSNKKEDNK